VSHVWRLATGRYSPLKGEGARLVGGRWNSPGRPLIYASESLALALAECLVHVTGKLPPDYVAYKIAVPDDAVEYLDSDSLKSGWELDLGYSRKIGDKWLAEQRTVALAVPSAVLPESMNTLLNPVHPRSVELRIEVRQPFRFDPRLRRNP
jgi:RES domain-containing protein